MRAGWTRRWDGSGSRLDIRASGLVVLVESVHNGRSMASPTPDSTVQVDPTPGAERGEEAGLEDEVVSVTSSDNRDSGLESSDSPNSKSTQAGAPTKPPKKPRKKKTNGQTGRRRVTRQLTDALLKAFREEGPKYSQVARLAGCDRRLAKKAWEVGFPKDEMSPFKDIVAHEQEAARAAVRKDWENQHRSAHWADVPKDGASAELAKAREELAKDAIQSRKEEAQMVRLLRTDTTNTLAAVARLLPGIQEWAKQANLKMLQKGPATVGEALKMMEQASRIVDRIGSAASTVMQMERRLLGQPESIVGVAMPDLTFEDAMTHLRASDRTMARAERLGLVPEGTTDGLRAERGRVTNLIDIAELPDDGSPALDS